MPKATFMGHSCVLLTDGKHKVMIDPFLSGNEKAAVQADKVDVDFILITHGHGDHIGDAVAIAKRTGATTISNYEITNLVSKQGVQKAHPLHIGGGADFPFGRVKMTIAHHGGGYGPDASIYTGPAAGFLVTIGGKVVYHAGDTGLFYDMKLIGDMNKIDLAFLPIGDNFTMGVDDAVKAVEFLGPRHVVPMHYDTFPIIQADPQQFARKVIGSQVHVLKPGESLDF
jgi:L-ascorbate metabolism protein UlaG (beta-lactamase superfamily)